MNHNSPIPIHALISTRKSLRAYDANREISDNELESLFLAAASAPSAYNEQPWRFIYGRKGTPTYDLLFSVLASSNQVWAQQAPVLILAVSKLHNTHNGQPNRHALHDTGLAMGMLTVQATSLGINLHQMGGFDQAKAEELFNIPTGYEAVTITAAGHPGDPGNLPEALRERDLAPRVRKPIKEFVSTAPWPNTN